MVDLALPAIRPSISELCKTHCLKPFILAILARVPEETLEAMLVCRPVKREEAQAVLDELSLLLCRECTLETVYVPLRDGISHE
jgi:hypothetical protein